MGVLVGELLITMAALALEVARNVLSVKNVNVGTQVSAQAEAGSVYIQKEKSPRRYLRLKRRLWMWIEQVEMQRGAKRNSPRLWDS